jgi:hypothetical protein
MSSAAGEKRIALTRSVVIWAGLLILVIAALVSAIGILNRDVFSAQGFVRMYLDALSRHDVAAALATPGVVLPSADAPGTGASALVTPDALGDITDISLMSDTEIVPGRHRLVFSYELVGLDRHVSAGQSEFDVVHTGTITLLFPQWAFAKSPVAHATVTVAHAADFTAGSDEVAIGDPADFHASATYDVLVPSMYVLSHRSDYLGAKSVGLAATAPTSSISAIVDVQPTTTLLNAVQSKVNAFLDDCATKQALYPPGCPFGEDVTDRITNQPTWKIEAYPVVTILAGESQWIVPASSASAHLTVDVRSLFDGTVSTLDTTVPFTVTFSFTIAADGTVDFAARP